MSALTYDESAAFPRSGRPLALSIAITGVVLIAEVVAGILTDSLALLADAGHMAADLGALGLSLGAVWLATRPPTPERTFGFKRAEVLAALANSLGLAIVAAFVFREAVLRMDDPPEVTTGPMLVVAAIGLAANVAAAAILARHQQESINVRSAFVHVAGDALSSVGVLAAAGVMAATNWFIADPIISIGIAALILVSSFRISAETLHILMEGAPPGVDAVEIQNAMRSVHGVENVHDFHIWTVTSGFVSLSAHVETNTAGDPHDVLVELRRLLAGRFNITHATVQIESLALHAELDACCGPGPER